MWKAAIGIHRGAYRCEETAGVGKQGMPVTEVVVLMKVGLCETYLSWSCINHVVPNRLPSDASPSQSRRTQTDPTPRPNTIRARRC